MTRRSSIVAAVPAGSHACWIVDDDDAYVQAAAEVLRAARERGERPVVFGPEGSAARAALSPLADSSADPRVAFLDGGPLVPERMYSMFHEQVGAARDAGYQGLALVADMDWLVPINPETDDVVAFELFLDRHAKELGATIVCAYRTSTFDTAALMGAQCVHPVYIGPPDEPQFRIVAGQDRSWLLSGEVDLGVAPSFGAAIAAATSGTEDVVVDVSQLHFIDVGAMRTIAHAGRMSGGNIRLVGARPTVKRVWKLAGFDVFAPTVELAS